MEALSNKFGINKRNRKEYQNAQRYRIAYERRRTAEEKGPNSLKSMHSCGRVSVKNDVKIEISKKLEFLSAAKVEAILEKLCEDDEIGRRALSLIDAELKKVDAEEIAQQVFGWLESIDVHDLWHNSGKTYYGYVEPSDLGHEMVEDVIRPIVEKIKLYRDLEMKAEEKAMCAGLIRGLMRFETEGANEFKDWIPDSIDIIADNIVYDFKNHNCEDDVQEIQLEIDACYEDDE
jgi:hypothetical protein